MSEAIAHTHPSALALALFGAEPRGCARDGARRRRGRGRRARRIARQAVAEEGIQGVAIPPESRPLAAITMGGLFETCDVPGGVINLISGLESELVPWLAAHMGVNAIGWNDATRSQSPYAIFDFQEIKTVWHPVGM
jgi:hypothetical protein